ncbi:MAG: beta-lactamase family protein [Chloroflexi bacterium]|nr:beta-lactamase family protein [Chloroflexota bacterium]
MKHLLRGAVLLVIIVISLSPAVYSRAQDESEFDGVWFVEDGFVVLNIEGDLVEILAPGQDGCTPMMELELDGDEVFENGVVVYTLELAEDDEILVIWQGDEVAAEAEYYESLDEVCTMHAFDISVETITSLDDVETLISEVFDQSSIPGMAVAIVGPQGVIWSGGYGFADVDKGLSVTPDTPFMLASVTKVFTGTSLMMAWEEAGFDLDMPVNDLLPFQVDNPHTDGEVITLRHLATHTSGLLDNWEIYNAMYTPGDSPIALGDFLEGYLTAGGEWYDADENFADWMPGEVAEYSNVGAALAGYMMEMITGTPLDDYADAHLFGPLGMTNTHWHLADFPDVSIIAIPYENGETALDHYGYPTWPDGQLRSSANDLGRFLATILNGGELDGVRILQPETIDAMMQPQIPTADPYQGWFWALGDKPGEAGHSGGDPGVATNIGINRNLGLGLILLTNSDSSEMSLVWDALAGPIFESAAVLKGE